MGQRIGISRPESTGATTSRPEPYAVTSGASRRSQNKSSVTSKIFILGRLQIRLWIMIIPKGYERMPLVKLLKNKESNKKESEDDSYLSL